MFIVYAFKPAKCNFHCEISISGLVIDRSFSLLVHFRVGDRQFSTIDGALSIKKNYFGSPGTHPEKKNGYPGIEIPNLRTPNSL